MPYYIYECQDCGLNTEVRHGMFDSPQLTCDRCKSHNLIKSITPCSIITKRSSSVVDMRQDLKENYGVHDMKISQNPGEKGFEKVYNDIKESGSFVKERMIQKREENQKKTKEKQRQWMKGALARTPKKAKNMKEKKAKENAKKRAIKLS